MKPMIVSADIERRTERFVSRSGQFGQTGRQDSFQVAGDTPITSGYCLHCGCDVCEAACVATRRVKRNAQGRAS